jgi:hypothetical protein
MGCAGMQLDVELHKTLLFLCSGGQNWDAKVQGPGQARIAAQNGASAAGSTETAVAARERGATNGQATTSGREQGKGQPKGTAQEAQPAVQMSDKVQMPSRVSDAWHHCEASCRLLQSLSRARLPCGCAQDWVYASKRGREIWEALDAKGAAKSEVRLRGPLASAHALIEGCQDMHDVTMNKA